MISAKTDSLLKVLGVSPDKLDGELEVTSPIDGQPIANVRASNASDVASCLDLANTAFATWRSVPAPHRGELVRLFGNVLRENKIPLGELVSVESGKILQEGLGEVQEMIDICDFAVGLSRQLYGLTIASERPGHRMSEYWHPMGIVGIISAFNFPVAVWSWNTTLALVCGNAVVWKPSEKTPLTALACQALLDQAIAQFVDAPTNLSQVVIGDRSVGEQLADDHRVKVLSATGSSAMGKAVAPRVAARFGRAILELGGNNAVTVCPSADLKMALTAIVFGAVGTAGQRCTSTRRLFVHREIYDQLMSAVKGAYASVKIGNPLDEANLVGPLIDTMAFENMQKALKEAKEQGAIVTGGERVIVEGLEAGCYVRPAIVEMPKGVSNIEKETFAPILYVFPFSDFTQAILANSLSSMCCDAYKPSRHLIQIRAHHLFLFHHQTRLQSRHRWYQY